ncbi:MAG: non-canonical purine NTP pyrophosphatase, partial [Archangium sp.]
MKSIVFATGNAGKVKELEVLLGSAWVVKSGKDFPEIPDVVEDADTFEGNAAKKAHAFAKATGHWALADDSGLVVDALGGAPGVYSARYAPTESERIDRLLGAMDGQDKRTARFVCVLCLASPDGAEFFARGTCEGTIGFERKGNGG